MNKVENEIPVKPARKEFYQECVEPERKKIISEILALIKRFTNKRCEKLEEDCLGIKDLFARLHLLTESNLQDLTIFKLYWLIVNLRELEKAVKKEGREGYKLYREKIIALDLFTLPLPNEQ